MAGSLLDDPGALVRRLPDLPVRAVLGEVVAALGDGRLAVLEAPPGSGKTTLVPLALAAAGWCGGRVVVLEPRRVAARTAAERMAALVGEPVGRAVGWTTGDGSRTSAATRVEAVTEGVLLRRLLRDPSADGIGAIVLDEFHERAVEADLVLAFALEARDVLRPDLAVLVMSATLDGARLGELLGRPPVLRCGGEVHPVRTRHLPGAPSRTAGGPRRPVADEGVAERVAAAVRAVLETDPPDAGDAADHAPPDLRPVGDVLAFLPGQREIARAAAALEDLPGAGVDVRPLYGALPAAAQAAALAPSPAGRRRVVLATDIAESSLTVPGVRVVVDGGLARRPAFDPATGMSRLRTVAVSRASADQRRGRAARIGPGLCLRLWPEHQPLDAQAPAAILEEDLAPAALAVLTWGTAVDDLRLLDPPPAAAWAAALDLLRALDAVDDRGRLTAHGRRLGGLPTHPRLAHMLLAAAPSERALAVDVAAVLGGRDLLPGGDADLERRVGLVRGGSRGRRDVERLRRALARVDAAPRSGDDPHGRAGSTDHGSSDDRGDAVGRLVALAYPDRVAVARGRRGAFVLAGGRGAGLPAHDPLAGEALLAVAHLDRGDVEARIRLAAPLDRASVDALARTEDHVAWTDGDVVAERRRRFGAAVLSTTPLADPPRDAVVAALLEGVREEQLRPLPWGSGPAGAAALRDRLRHLHRSRPDEGWPAVDDATLLAELEGWLGPFLLRARRRRDLGAVPLGDALLARVPGPLHHRLDELAPTHVVVPSGSRVPVGYAGDRPVLAVKLQELFGLTRTPEVAGAPLLLHLLSPARRPVQVTDDLAGFWQRGYPVVRAELRGRYPKHPWPEDPRTAQPTARTTGRSRGGS